MNKKTTTEFVQNENNSFIRNQILQREDFYISYNPDTKLINVFLIPTLNNTIRHETALVKDEDFYILEGDFREGYREIIKNGGGWDECIEFFMNNLEHYSWSSTYSIREIKEKWGNGDE